MWVPSSTFSMPRERDYTTPPWLRIWQINMQNPITWWLTDVTCAATRFCCAVFPRRWLARSKVKSHVFSFSHYVCGHSPTPSVDLTHQRWFHIIPGSVKTYILTKLTGNPIVYPAHITLSTHIKIYSKLFSHSLPIQGTMFAKQPDRYMALCRTFWKKFIGSFQYLIHLNKIQSQTHFYSVDYNWNMYNIHICEQVVTC